MCSGIRYLEKNAQTISTVQKKDQKVNNHVYSFQTPCCMKSLVNSNKSI